MKSMDAFRAQMDRFCWTGSGQRLTSQVHAAYHLIRHHWITFCHTVSAEFGHRTVNPPLSARTIRPARVCGVTSVGLVLVFTVSIKCALLTSHVPVRWYVFVRSGWLNHDSSTKPPSAAMAFVHRMLVSCLNHTPAKCCRKSLSKLSTLARCQHSNTHAAAMTTGNPTIAGLFMACNDA